ncbi:MAG: 2-oxoacid:acceptor oxidoreductase family protein [Nitrospirota bacterium]
MYHIRFHGRGGQGIKTAGRILGTAFFLEGFEVQDAPRYGAERRGAPIFAYVRASQKVINERGIIRRPDLIIVADDSLMPIPAAGILQGAGEHTILLVNSDEKSETWKDRLNFPGRVIILSASGDVNVEPELPFVGAMCAGAAARLVGVVSPDSLKQAIQDELGTLGEAVVKKNVEKALEAYDLIADNAGCVTEGETIPADNYESPEWVDMPFEDARVSAPAIHGAATSVKVKTGLWRTMRPVIDYDRCHRCWWICSTFCPDSAVNLNNEGYPEIDYEHCKGCMICVAKCPRHVIEAIPEKEAQAEKAGGGKP